MTRDLDSFLIHGALPRRVAPRFDSLPDEQESLLNDEVVDRVLQEHLESNINRAMVGRKEAAGE